jgi:hypothetical protein
MKVRLHNVAALFVLLGMPLGASAERYPSATQLKLVRSAMLYLAPDGAYARLDEVEWCEEMERFLRERGFHGVRQRHEQVVNDVAVPLPPAAFRSAAQDLVKLLTSAPPPLSRFQSRFEVRRYDNTLLTGRYEGEQWKEIRESRPDPVPFTIELAHGHWMVSAEHTADRGVRIALWDKIGEANPYDVQAVLVLADGSLHRSSKVAWEPAGVEVFFPADFPTLKARKIPLGPVHVIFEADGRTIEWPRSLPFQY